MKGLSLHKDIQGLLREANSIAEIQSALQSLPNISIASSRAAYRYHLDSLTYATYPDETAKEIANNYSKIIALGIKSGPISFRSLETQSGYTVIELNWGTSIKELISFNSPSSTLNTAAREQLKNDFQILAENGLRNLNGSSGTAHWHITPDGQRIIIDNWDKLQTTSPSSVALELEDAFFSSK